MLIFDNGNTTHSLIILYNCLHNKITKVFNFITATKGITLHRGEQGSLVIIRCLFSITEWGLNPCNYSPDPHINQTQIGKLVKQNIQD